MTLIDAERFLAMSVFQAAFTIREFRARFPTLSEDELIDSVRRLRGDLASYDYQHGLVLEQLVDAAFVASVASSDQFFTACVDAVAAKGNPIWIRLAPSGRDRVVKAMSLNGVQCLRSAGLLEAPPSPRVFQWWDQLAGKVRADRDERLLALGREGELLSLERERERLAMEGLALEPVWVAIEDNRIGYDILSYSKTPEGHTNRLIEVKATTSQPPSFIITRNEWLKASQFGDTLEFHVWSFPKKTLRILAMKEVQPHIPLNQGEGEWLETEIVLDADQ